jgi:hypothetical protein
VKKNTADCFQLAKETDVNLDNIVPLILNDEQIVKNIVEGNGFNDALKKHNIDFELQKNRGSILSDEEKAKEAARMIEAVGNNDFNAVTNHFLGKKEINDSRKRRQPHFIRRWRVASRLDII